VSTEDRIALARSFAETHFVSKGLAVQLDVHAPHEGDAESERANRHAHLLITTRRLDGEQFNAKKARDLDSEVWLAGARASPTGRCGANSGASIRTSIFASTGLECGSIPGPRMHKSISDRCGCALPVQRSSNVPRSSGRPTRRQRAIRIRCWQR
jgi:MobA/MobL family